MKNEQKQMKAELGIWPKDRQQLHQILPLNTPLSMDFLVSNVCNFKCNYCIQSGTTEQFEKSGYKKQFMDWETFELGVKQVKEFPHKLKMLVFHGHGEPTLNKHLPEMIKLVRKENIAEKVIVITNGSVLTPEYSHRLINAGLQELRISLQGLSSEKYMEISQAKIDWEEFYENIVYFSKIKGNCRLSTKIADTALESEDEKRFFELFGGVCDAVGIEHIYECFAHLGKNYAGVPYYKVAKNRWGEEIAGPISVCWLPFGKMDLSADGRFTNCCAALFGFERNIREVSMLEMWNSPVMNKMREDFLRHNMDSYTACHKCHVPMGTFHPEDILDGHEVEILKRMSERGMISSQ